MFADDCVIFNRARHEEWKHMQEIMGRYEKASGQTLNKQKTSILFSSNTSSAIKRQIVNEVWTVSFENYEKYLGLPVVVGRAKYNIFSNIKERVWKRIQNWKNSFLSKTGKEVLIKVVLLAIPTYSMSVFIVPKKLCKDLEAMFSRFWWRNKQNEKGIHWWSCDKMSYSKAMRGMGFRNMELFNKAMLAKQV